MSINDYYIYILKKKVYYVCFFFVFFPPAVLLYILGWYNLYDDNDQPTDPALWVSLF